MAERYADIREGVRALCAQFPAAYFREVDAHRTYPEAFVTALTRAGWLAALIPQEYGGSGLGVCEASVIMLLASRRPRIRGRGGDPRTWRHHPPRGLAPAAESAADRVPKILQAR